MASCHCILTSLEPSDHADSTSLSRNANMLGFSIVNTKISLFFFFPGLTLQDYVNQNQKYFLCSTLQLKKEI